MCKRKIVYVLAAVALTATGANFANRTCLAGPEKTDSQKRGSPAVETRRYGLGRPAMPTDFARHEYLVGPKGTALQKGRGTARGGRASYLQSCVACDGLRAEGTNAYRPAVGGREPIQSNQH